MKTNTLERNLDAVSGLFPQALWKHFVTLCMNPRGSGNEEAIAQIIVDMATDRGFEVTRDALSNVLVSIPASPGLENTPSICLQGHLDMVCEKNEDVSEMFPIELLKDGNKLTANGTTLGADNGISVAAMMALISNRRISHGPLELLFTTVEETGMDGAEAFDYSLIKSRRILNLDSEEEGILYVGCAGGCNIDATFKPVFKKPTSVSIKYEVKVSGLLGGHSGVDIHLGRTNALVLLANILSKFQNAGVQLISFSGGNAMNAIPREAKATFLVPIEQMKMFNTVLEGLQTELGSNQNKESVDVSFQKVQFNGDERVFIFESQRDFLRLILSLPNGVIKFEPKDSSMVQTSNNIGVVKMDGENVIITCLYRSSLESALEQTGRYIQLAFGSVGAEMKLSGKFSPWEPQFESGLLTSVLPKYEKAIGRKATVQTIHAGLECSVFYRKMPKGTEILSVGPEMGDVHSPDEWVDIDSVGAFWSFLLLFLGTE